MSGGSSFVFWICLFVGCTALPMSIDLLRVFLPRKFLSGRLVEAWQRPLLLAMVVCLCVWAYAAFFPIVQYSHDPGSTAWLGWLALITILWINSVWNYAACAVVDPGYAPDAAVASTAPPPAAPGGGTAGWLEAATASARADAHDAAPARTDGAYMCRICERRVRDFDHHCPFTGGCVGHDNFRFFMLFLLHCTLGCGLACVLSWRPFLECVLRQCTVPYLGLYRTPPPDESACVDLGARSLLLLPALCLHLALAALGAFHALLLFNGLTTLQFTRRWRSRGVRAFRDLLMLHGEVETDKWALLWGAPAPSTSALRRARLLLLPSLPRRRRAGPGVAKGTSWLGAAAVLAVLFLLLPLAAASLEAAALASRTAFTHGVRGLADSITAPHGTGLPGTGLHGQLHRSERGLGEPGQRGRQAVRGARGVPSDM